MSIQEDAGKPKMHSVGASQPKKMSLLNLLGGLLGPVAGSFFGCGGLTLIVLPYDAPAAVLTSAGSFVAATTVVHLVALAALLPADARVAWAAVSAAGATGYWLVLWALFLFPFRDALANLYALPYDPQLTRDMFMRALSLTAPAGAASGLTLGGVQWLLLRRHVATAWLWAVVIVLGNTGWFGVMLSSLITSIHGY